MPNLLNTLMAKAVNLPDLPAKPDLAPKPNIIISDSTNRGLRLEDPSGRFSGDYDEHLAGDIIRAAKKHGEDPFTAVAMGLQETRLGRDNDLNPMHWMNLSEETPDFFDFSGPAADTRLDALTASMERWKENRRAGRVDPSDESLDIQSYNGLGKLLPGLYGQAEALHGRRDRPYGKRIMELRENVIKPNAKIQELVKRLVGG